MNPYNMPYDICRCYISDNAGLLGEELVLRLNGMLRNRDCLRLAESTLLCAGLPTQQRLAAFPILRQVEAFFKKNKSLADPVNCEIAAWFSFGDAEDQCRETNSRLDKFYESRESLEISRAIGTMQTFIERVLGDRKGFLDELPLRIRVTSGASATRSRRNAHPTEKIRLRNVHCGHGARPLVRALAYWFGYPEPTFRGSSCNRVTFVPKSLRTFRTIACEPDGALPLQLAFDGYIKSRLRCFGVNLHSQTLNQELARQGSIDGSYATIDLKSASDTVAYNTVCLLFPKEWFTLLDAIRSSHYGDGKRYHKFSSMGNATTFGIETLIFTAACVASGSKDHAVYGDDIVIRPQYLTTLRAILAYLGFTINSSKSFDSGEFRESCGSDWLNGKDITPFYMRCIPSRKTEWCHLVNGLVQISLPYGRLEALAHSYVRSQKLMLVPFNDVSTSGVWIDTHTAHSLKYFKFHHSSRSWHYKQFNYTYMCYVAKMKGKKVCTNSAALFLWHLRASSLRDKTSIFISKNMFHRRNSPEINKRLIFDVLGRELDCSTVPGFTYKVCKSRVSWFTPARTVPLRLYSWSDLVTHEDR